MMYLAETVASFDITEVVVAMIGAFGLVVAAFVTAGWLTKRAVKTTVSRSVDAAVTGVGEAELSELQGIRSELHLLRSHLTTSNQLAAQQWATMDRRVQLLEDRVDTLERV